jgi:4'-phosphopantetheinyl transferase
MDGPDSRAVHLWIVRLEAGENNFARSLAVLSPEETARAERFHFDRHRRAFVLGRAALRFLLASYLDMDAAVIQFVYGPQGKPALAPMLKNGPCSLRFNASHSGDLAAYTFTSGCEIGVDVERYRELPDLENIARRFFSPEEAAELLELSANDKASGFFNCWTRKEAYIKAMGGGLSIPLDSFRVTLVPGAAARMVSLDGSNDAARHWTLYHFTPAPHYAGAIAYPGDPRAIQTGSLMSVDGLLEALASR